MKIMITGANGTIGADLVNFFIKNIKSLHFIERQTMQQKILKIKILNG